MASRVGNTPDPKIKSEEVHVAWDHLVAIIFNEEGQREKTEEKQREIE